MRLYLTANGRYVGTQAEAKAEGKGWTPEEVPTDKAGLIDYLNALAHEHRRTPKLTIIDEAGPIAEGYGGVDPHQPQPLGWQKPLYEAAPLTQTRVDEMFTPGGDANHPLLDRDAVCAAISAYTGTDLGYVALEVAARFTALGKGI